MNVVSRSPWSLPVFRLVAHLEALSWAGLLVGMVLERATVAYATLGDHLVFAFGSVHGGLVIAYVATALLVGTSRRWRPATFALALAATVPPFATVAFDRWALRRGAYARRDAGGARTTGD